MDDDARPIPKARSNGAPVASTAKHGMVARSSYEQGLEFADDMIARGETLRALSAKQECFAIAMSEGSSASEAYRYAYQCQEIPSQISQKASVLIKQPAIAARVRALKAQLEHKLLRDRDKTQRYVIDNLQKIIELPGTHHSARVHALTMLGKLSGLFDGSNNGANAGADKQTTAEVERELREKLSAMLGDKAKGIKGLAMIEHDQSQVIANNPDAKPDDSTPISADSQEEAGEGGLLT
jgi:hypothetical protein